jgi:hypothetical protein
MKYAFKNENIQLYSPKWPFYCDVFVLQKYSCFLFVNSLTITQKKDHKQYTSWYARNPASPVYVPAVPAPAAALPNS